MILDQIGVADILAAVSAFTVRSTEHGPSPATGLELLMHGHKRYPVDAIVTIAAHRVIGRQLAPDETAGDEGSPAVRLLLERGFEIVTPRRRVGLLDATFSVGRHLDERFLLFECRGPGRNTGYAQGLESILDNLASLNASVDNVSVASLDVIGLPSEHSNLPMTDPPYPIALATVPDMRRLRRGLGSLAAAVGRTRDSGGNSTERLRIAFSIGLQTTSLQLADVLSAQGSDATVSPTSFHFSPSTPSSSLEAGNRREVQGTNVARVHLKMQHSLYEELVKVHGEANVAAEQPMASGAFADLVVQHGDTYDIYELKTDESPRECVRQALGQIMEYAYWPGSPPVSALWIVGPAPIDEQGQEYVSTLQGRFSMPLKYRQQAR